MASSPSVPRQMPEKLTTAPISVRPLVRPAISRPMSKSASWMRMVTAAAMNESTAGHRREEGDLTGARYHGIGFDVGMVDGGADHARSLECMGVALAASGQPGDQIVDGANVRRRLDRLLGL